MLENDGIEKDTDPDQIGRERSAQTVRADNWYTGSH